MIKQVNIKNFKSIVDETIDLSTLNVFIGANGAGKSNILEAVGFIAAQSGGEINLNNLVSAGIRVARPDLMVNSFYEKIQRKTIEVTISSESVVCKKTITLQDYGNDSSLTRLFRGWDEFADRYQRKVLLRRTQYII